MNKKILFTACTFLCVYLISCGSNQQQTTNEKTQPAAASTPANDNSKGVGKFTHVELTHPLDNAMVDKGKSIFSVKCNACHKLTDEKLVGPGWKGVTDRRKPEWIMNFATNTDEMLDKDENAKALVEVCMVRMPNQHLSDDEAREILEFMRSNDGKN